jgi:hypothetical protein
MRPRLDQATQKLLHARALAEGRSDSNMLRVIILKEMREHVANSPVPEAGDSDGNDTVMLCLPKGLHKQAKYVARLEDRSTRNFLRQLIARGLKQWPLEAAAINTGRVEAAP